MEYGTTAHNRTVCASPPYGGSGYAKMQSGLRPLCVFSPPHFLCAGIASQFLYRAQKTSHTAKTLCAIALGVPKTSFICTETSVTLAHNYLWYNDLQKKYMRETGNIKI